MPTYFITEVVTREGMMSVDEAPARAKGVVDAAAGFGLELVEFYFTTGPHDFIMKVESPDDESVAAFVMAVRKSGNVTAQSFRAFSPDEWAGIVVRLS